MGGGVGGCPEDTGGTLEKNGIRGTLGPPQAENFGILIDFLGGKQCFQCISQPFGGQNSPNFSPAANLKSPRILSLHISA